MDNVDFLVRNDDGTATIQTGQNTYTSEIPFDSILMNAMVEQVEQTPPPPMNFIQSPLSQPTTPAW